MSNRDYLHPVVHPINMKSFLKGPKHRPATLPRSFGEFGHPDIALIRRRKKQRGRLACGKRLIYLRMLFHRIHIDMQHVYIYIYVCAIEYSTVNAIRNNHHA